MRFCRFDDERLGLVEGNSVRDVTAALDVLPRCSYPLPQHDIFIANLDGVTTRARAVAKDARALPLDERDAAQPGRQSRQDHRRAGQLSEAPRRGARQPAAARQQSRQHVHDPDRGLVSEGDELARRARARASSSGVPKRRTDHEVELAVVIGRTASHVKRARGAGLRRRVLDRPRHLDPRQRGPQLPQVAGFVQRARALARDRRRDSRSWRARSADHGQRSSCVSSRTRGTSILGVPELIEMASAFYTLQPGDLLFTGTPEGVSPIQAGDRIVATIDKIGSMSVATRADESRSASELSGATAGA